MAAVAASDAVAFRNQRSVGRRLLPKSSRRNENYFGRLIATEDVFDRAPPFRLDSALTLDREGWRTEASARDDHSNAPLTGAAL